MTETGQTAIPNSLVLEDRKRLTAEGVREIGAYDDTGITAQTDVGMLTIRGRGLKIVKMSVDTGELAVEGDISELIYSDVSGSGEGGFWSRVFR